MNKSTNRDSVVRNSEVKAREKLGEGEESEAQYWRYYKQAQIVFSKIPGFKLEISPTVPSGYRWLKALDTPANGLKDLTDGLTKYLSPVLTPADYDYLQDFCLDHSDGDFKFFAYMLPVVCLGEGDARSKINRAIAQELSMSTNAKHSITMLHSTALSEVKPEEVVSFIPEFEQFPLALRTSGLKFEDFFQWFYGAAEAELMALHIGRAGTGPQGATLVGESQALEHSYRTALIVKSMPQLGKTWFNEFLIKGFEFCGMKTAPIQDLGTRFGHGDWLASAWAYADDTTKSMLNNFYNSAVIKTACSSGLLKSEKKGENSFDVKSMCAPILMANDTDSRDIAKGDSGNANRIKVVCTKVMEEAKAYVWSSDSPLFGCPGTMPAAVVTFLCDKYEVSAEVLAAYLIRLCTDYFRSFSLLGLIAKIDLLSEKLFVKNNTANLQSLANAAVWSYLMRYRLGDIPEIEELKIHNDSAINSSALIIESLRWFYAFRCANKKSLLYPAKVALFYDYVQKGKPTTHPWRGFEAYGLEAIKALEVRCELYAYKLEAKGFEAESTQKIFAKLFTDLADTQGVSSQYSVAMIQEKWRSSLRINFEPIWAAVVVVRSKLGATNRVGSLEAITHATSIWKVREDTILLREELLNEESNFEATVPKLPSLNDYI